MSPYKRALHYAYVLDPQNYRDHVHNAYIYHHKKTGENIFERHTGYILRCVKYMWLWHRSNRTFHKEFVDYVDEDHFTTLSPDRLFEANERVDAIRKRIASYHSGADSSINPELLSECLGYIEDGYTGNEISKMMGISAQTASNYKKKIKQLITAEHAEVESA